MKAPKMSTAQQISMPSLYDGMEKSGKKQHTKEIFKRNPYKNTTAEVKRNEEEV